MTIQKQHFPACYWISYATFADDFCAENFMTGYRVVFDREKLVLGWKKFNCEYLSNVGICMHGKLLVYSWHEFVDLGAGYDVEESTASKPRNSTSVPPAVAVGLGNNSIPKSEEYKRNTSLSSIASPVYQFCTIPQIYPCLEFLVLFFLLVLN